MHTEIEEINYVSDYSLTLKNAAEVKLLSRN